VNKLSSFGATPYRLKRPKRNSLTWPDRKVVVLIDGLDEANRDGKNELAAFIASEFARAPKWLRLIITSRPDPEVIYPLQALTPHKLETSDPENARDIQQYLLRELATGGNRKQISNDIVQRIIERSEGVFLYASWVRQELAEGRLSLGRPDEFPQGLGGVYAQFFQRQFSDIPAYENDVLPVLEVLAAAQEPLEVELLARIFDWDISQRRKFLRSVGSLLLMEHDLIQPFHTSLIEWVTDPERAGPYFVCVQRGGRVLADFCSRQHQSGVADMPGYAMGHLARHLADSECWEELVDLLTDVPFLERKISRSDGQDDNAGRRFYGGVHAVHADYDYALDRLPVEHTERSHILRAYAQAFAAKLHILAVDPQQTRPQLYAALAESCRYDDPVRKHADAHVASSAASPWLRQDNWLVAEAHRPLLRTVEQHVAPVTALIFDPSGGYITSADARGFVQIWDVETGAVRAVLETGGSPVRSLAFGAEGTLLYAVDGGQRLHVWRWATQTLVGSCQIGEVTSMTLLDSAKLLVTGHDNGNLTWWDLESLEELHVQRRAHLGAIRCIQSFPDGRRFVSGGEGHAVRLWDGIEKCVLSTWRAHQDRVLSLAVSPDQSRIASGSRDRTILLYKPDVEEPIHKLTGHVSRVEALHFARGASRLLSASYDRTIRLWDVENGTCVGTVGGHERWIRCLDVAAGNRYVVSGSQDGRVKIWSGRIGDDDHAIDGHAHWVLATAVLDDCRHYVSASRDHTIRIWDIQDETRRPEVLKGHRGWVQAIAVRVAANEICTCGNDRTVRAWSTRGDGRSRFLFKHSEQGRAIAAHGEWVCIGGREGGLWLWWEGDKRPRRIPLEAERITDMVADPNGEYVLVRCNDRSVRMIDIDRRREVWRFEDERGPSAVEPDRRCSETVVGMSSTGNYILSGSAEGHLCVWKRDNREAIFRRKAHLGGVRAACMLAGERQIVTGGRDGVVRLWSMTSGEAVAEFVCSTEPSSLTCLDDRDQICLIENSLPQPRVRLFSVCQR
jgi:WD40 repeat protein